MKTDTLKRVFRKMKSFFALIIFISSVELNAQDTIWIDISGEVSIKSKAWFYKLTNYTKTINGEYYCETFWLNNSLKSKYTCSDETLQDFNGSFVSWYN